MRRKGRNLEEVVKLLEEALIEQNIEVKSPDYIPDKDTGQPREVDISLRGNIGSSKFLIIIECRDRIEMPDSTWIEQIACKRESVGADKVIAVSSTGFTEPAKIKAQKNKIELRTFEEIDPQEMRQLFLLSGHINLCRMTKDVHRIHINCYNPNKEKIELPAEMAARCTPDFDWDAPIFIIKKNGTYVSLNYIWSCFSDKLYSNVPNDGTKIRLPIRLNFPNEDDRFQLLSLSGPIDVTFIEFDAILWVENEKVFPTLTRSYKDCCKEKRKLAEIQEFEFDMNNKKIIMDFINPEVSGKQGISLRTKEKAIEANMPRKTFMTNSHP